MSPSIDIPAPLDDDSDSVVTALETAAVFAGRGDAVEALRWLKRAAESSGETGDDARTLTLARTAADLTTQIQSAQSTAPSGPPPLPAASAAPPAQSASETPRSGSLPTALRASQPASATKISPIVQISDRPAAPKSALPEAPKSALPSEAAPAAQSAQPSQRWLPKPPPRTSSIPTGAERIATRPPPPSSRPLTPTPPIAEARPLGGNSGAEPRSLGGNSVPPTVRESALPNRDTLTPARDTLTSAIPASVAGVLAHAPLSAKESNGERRSLSVGPRSSAPVERVEAEAPRLRQAARVSVVRSSTDRSLYLVRVLEEGKPVPSDAAEGWLLLVDPNSNAFSR